MNNPIANLFLSLQTQIAALSGPTEADPNVSDTYFKHVDQDLGQLEMARADGRPPVQWPCVLIDIDDVTYAEIGDNDQIGNVNILLRLGFPPFSASSAATPQLYKEKAIYFYELEQVIYKALSGKCPPETDLQDIFGKYVRMSAKTEHREDWIRVRQITYTIPIQDFSADNGPTLIPTPPINITDEFIFPE